MNTTFLRFRSAGDPGRCEIMYMPGIREANRVTSRGMSAAGATLFRRDVAHEEWPDRALLLEVRCLPDGVVAHTPVIFFYNGAG